MPGILHLPLPADLRFDVKEKVWVVDPKLCSKAFYTTVHIFSNQGVVPSKQSNYLTPAPRET